MFFKAFVILYTTFYNTYEWYNFYRHFIYPILRATSFRTYISQMLEIRICY